MKTLGELLREQQPGNTSPPWVGFYDQGKPFAIMPAMRPGDVCTFAKPPSDVDFALMLKGSNSYAALCAFLKRVASLDDNQVASKSVILELRDKARRAMSRIVDAP